ncbi:hypothetical protein S83_057788 [Arachis hypogaea]
MEHNFMVSLLFLLLITLPLSAESKCSKSCDLALASYYLWNNDSSLLYISYIMQSNLLHKVEDIVLDTTKTPHIHHIP